MQLPSYVRSRERVQQAEFSHFGLKVEGDKVSKTADFDDKVKAKYQAGHNRLRFTRISENASIIWTSRQDYKPDRKYHTSSRTRYNSNFIQKAAV